MLVTKNYIFSILKEFDDDILKSSDVVKISIFLRNLKDLKESIFERLYIKLNVSMRAILKSLINHKFIIGTEKDNEYLIDDLTFKLNSKKIFVNQINILSTKEFLNKSN